MMIRRMSLLASNPTCTVVSIIVTIRKCWDYLLALMLESRGHRGTTGSKTTKRRTSMLKIKTVSLLYDHLFLLSNYYYILITISFYIFLFLFYLSTIVVSASSSVISYRVNLLKYLFINHT